MNLLFLTIDLPDLSKEGGDLYADLIRELVDAGHTVTVFAPALPSQKTGIYFEYTARVLRIKNKEFVGNYPFYQKIYGIMSLTFKYKYYYNKYFGSESFDWIIMPTPPASLVDVVKPIMNKSGAKFYILLRDIQPECRERALPIVPHDTKDVYPECMKTFHTNIVMKKYLYRKAQEGYKLANIIGCMSKANMDFVKLIAPYVKEESIKLLPNWYREVPNISNDKETEIREKYGLNNKFVAIFGGTITQAQAVWNIAALAKHNLDKEDVVILVVGRGSHKAVLERMVKQNNLSNVRFLNFMPRDDFEQILRLSDLGIISLDEKYKVPTCPSKIIGYMALKIPVLAMFNEGNDYGEYYMGGNICGLWSTGRNDEKMFANFEWFYNHPIERKQMGLNGYEYFKKNFDSKVVCEELCKQLEDA